jgi:hypothetical protein
MARSVLKGIAPGFPYLPNPGLCYMVLTYPETRPYMLFLSPGSSPGQAWLIALHHGFLQTSPRDVMTSYLASEPSIFYYLLYIFYQL